MRNLVEFCGVIIFMMICFFVPAFSADYYQCSTCGDMTGRHVEYSGFQCWVEVEGKMVPKEYVLGDVIELRAGDKQ